MSVHAELWPIEGDVLDPVPAGVIERALLAAFTAAPVEASTSLLPTSAADRTGGARRVR